MCIIVGSTPYSQWQTTTPLLQQIGLAVESGETVENWYSQVLRTSDNNTPLTLSAELSKNADALIQETGTLTLIGVEHPNNSALLPFWAQQHKDTQFVLYFTHPEVAVINALLQGADPTTALDSWKKNTRSLLSFYRHNRRRCALFDINSALNNPADFLGSFTRHFGLATHVENPVATTPPPLPQLLALVANAIVNTETDLSPLMAELEACSLNPIATPNTQLDLPALHREFKEGEAAKHELTAAHEEIEKYSQQLDSLKQAHDTARDDNQLLGLQLQQVQDELETIVIANQENRQHADRERALLHKQCADLKAAAADHEKQHQAQLMQLKSQLAELEKQQADTIQENELLLLQLHQVQEELEATFIAGKENTQRANTERALHTQQVADLKAAAADHEKQYQTQLKQLTSQLAALEKQQADTREENDLLLLQLHQVQEELESSFIASKENKQRVDDDRALYSKQIAELKASAGDQEKRHTAQLNQLTAQLATLEKQLANATHANTELEAQLQLVQQELESGNSDIAQENELLLLQLHQVQEELEHYFLHYQELSKQQQTAQKIIAIKSLPESELKLNTAGKVGKERLKKLFHAKWYQQQAGKRSLPLSHYLRYGWKKKFSPHPLFDPDFYIQANRLEGLSYCPLVHFMDVGHKLGLAPHPLFDSEWYLTEYPDIKESGVNPLLHYLNEGAAEGRNPSPQFDTEWYLATYPDVKESGINPLLHFAQFGERDQRKCNPFDC